MCGLRSRAIERGWLRADEQLLVPRLAFPQAVELPDVVHDANRATRDRVIDEMLNGPAQPEPTGSLFGPEDEITVAEVDRYGIPIRTVLGTRSGMMRSDPYYDGPYLARFYATHYRALYRPRRFSHAWFFSEQVRNGQRIMERVATAIPSRGRILDVGCGMGGMLVPFLFAGHQTCGCDYGAEYADRGRALGLDIRPGGADALAGEPPFDLVILSHVLEHVADPVAFLRQVASLLSSKGICYIEVPGLMNLDRVYDGDLLLYLQNAHRWHFTAATLAAVARRAGLGVEACDPSIACLARRAEIDSAACPADGALVLAEIGRLERSLEARRLTVARAAA